MSSRLTIHNHPFFTPQLKRTAHHHSALRNTSTVPSYLPIHSRFAPLSSRTSNLPPNNSQKQQLKPLYDGASTMESTLTIEKQEGEIGEIAEINQILKDAIEEDCKIAERSRERKGYAHTYDEQPLQEQIWIGQPREIPKKVFEEVDLARSQQQDNGEEKINLLQGFLPELGLFYYSIQQTLMFFEAETISSESPQLCYIKWQRKALSALFGIQVFSLGQPYFESKRSVMVFLHPYEAEMYHYQFKRVEQVGYRNLILKPLQMRCPLPLEKPNRLELSPKGYLYCSDINGKVYKIDFRDQWWRIGQRPLSSKKVKTSAMGFIRNTTKFLTASLKTFTRSVRNFTLSFWRRRPAQTQLLFEQEKQMVIVFIKEQGEKEKDKDKDYAQSFLIYDQKTNELLYTLKDIEFLKKKEEIMLVKRLEYHPDSKYNFIILLKSGKRVLLDIQNDRLKRSATLQQPPLAANETSNRLADSSSFFLEQNLMGQVTFADHCYLILVGESSKESQSVWQIKLERELNDAASIYLRSSEPFGERKRDFLQYYKGITKPQNMPESSRQVFFPPRQLYFSTDQIVQRIKMLRPIDTFYSIFKSFAQNVPDFFKKLKRLMPDTSSKEIVAFCTQIIVDPEGKYYVSPSIQFALDSHSNFPKPWSDGELEEYSYKDIDAKTRQRVMGIMLDTVASGKSEKGERQRALVEGVLKYYGRLFRTVLFSNINNLSSEGCKAIGHVLQLLRKLLLDLQKQLNCDLKSYIGQALRWVHKLRQVVMLAKEVPNLPALTLDEALLQPPTSFHPHIFSFLLKQCREQVFDQVKELMPSLITADFTSIYRLYCEVSPIKDPAKILELCRQHQDLPDYFIEYLVKQKKAPEAVLLKGFCQKQKPEEATYKDKMREFYSNRSSLYEKGQILMQASILLTQESKQTKEDRREEHQELQTLKGQLRLQQLIIEAYQARIPSKRKGLFSNYMPTELTSGEKEVVQRLNTCLLDRPFLQQVIDQLDSTLLKVVYAYHFDSVRFEGIFFQLAEEIFLAHQDNFSALSQSFQEEMRFMLVKAELGFTPEQVKLILDTYLCLLAKCPKLPQIMASEQKISDKNHFWPLAFAAEIGQQAIKLYEWGRQRLLDLERNSPEFLYMALCCSYLVIDFVPERKEDFIGVLTREVDERPELKQVLTMILH